MKLYHMDRCKTLTDGQRVQLCPLSELGESVQNSKFLQAFPNGISYHGKRYLDIEAPHMSYVVEGQFVPIIHLEALKYASKEACSKMIELVFELVRRSCFTDQPSRLNSFFAVKNISDFDKWFDTEEQRNASVFELDAPENTPRYDANFLKEGLALTYNKTYWKLDFSTSRIFDVACMYWSGASSEQPRYEYLVQLPTTPIRQLVHMD